MMTPPALPCAAPEDTSTQPDLSSMVEVVFHDPRGVYSMWVTGAYEVEDGIDMGDHVLGAIRQRLVPVGVADGWRVEEVLTGRGGEWHAFRVRESVSPTK